MAGIGARAASLAYRAGAETARVLPRAPGELLARGLSLGMTAMSGTRRRQVARHLRRVSGGRLQGFALARSTVAVFDNYGRYWHDFFRLPHDAPGGLEHRIDAEGFEHVAAGVAAGKGTILALPHLGNWDFAGAWLAARLRPLGTGLTVVAEPLEPPDLFDWFVELRREIGMEVVPLGPSATGAVLRALRDNRVVCLVCDRDLTGDGVAVEFFGEQTTLPGGPATLALRTGAPVLPVGNYILGGGRHRVRIGAPVPIERTGRTRDDVRRVTQELAHRLEALIRAAPEQWLLMQPNWPSDQRPPDRHQGDRAEGAPT